MSKNTQARYDTCITRALRAASSAKVTRRKIGKLLCSQAVQAHFKAAESLASTVSR